VLEGQAGVSNAQATLSSDKPLQILIDCNYLLGHLFQPEGLLVEEPGQEQDEIGFLAQHLQLCNTPMFLRGFRVFSADNVHRADHRIEVEQATAQWLGSGIEPLLREGHVSH
jgi:hypothetical protein